MTSPHDLPFEWGWRGMDLGPARPCQYTYYLYTYESLPPLPEFDGALAWLGSVDEEVDEAPTDQRTIEARDQLARIEREAVELGLTLPPAFVRLMSSPNLLDRIPEYASSWFPPLEHVVPCVVKTAGSLICFLRDQQDVVVWFLYLTPQGAELVIGSHDGTIDAAQWDEWNSWDGGEGPDDDELAEIVANAKICAPSFEAFIYRFWPESTLYSKLHGFDNAPLTADERRYLAHYEANPELSNA